MAQSGVAGVVTDDRAFVENYLRFGIAHYYGFVNLLKRAKDTSPDENECRSIGLEAAVAASQAFEVLLTWYYALRRWAAQPKSSLLVDTLKSEDLGPEKRLAALSDLTNCTDQGFCGLFSLPWRNKELATKGIDRQAWRSEVKRCKENLRLVLSNMEAPALGVAKPWMIDLWNRVKHGFLVEGVDRKGIPAVAILTEGSQLKTQHGKSTVFSSDCSDASLEKMATICEQIGIALHGLVRLVYVATWSQEPPRPSFPSLSGKA